MTFFILCLLLLIVLSWSYLWKRLVFPAITATLDVDATSISHSGAFTVTLAVVNNSRLPAPFVHCKLALPAGLSQYPPGGEPITRLTTPPLAVSLSLAARESLHVSFTLFASSRGVHALREFELEVADGWTPGRFRSIQPIYRFITVHPRIRPLTQSPRQDPTPIGERTRERKRFATSQDWIDLRPYRTGDTLRDIAWRVTAKRGELIVFERADTQSPDVVIVLNIQTIEHFRLGSKTSQVEAVIEECYALTLQLLRESANVHLYSNAGQFGKKFTASPLILTIQGPLTGALQARLGHALGGLSPYITHSFSDLLKTIRRAKLRPTQFLIVSGYADAASDRALADLRRDGHRIDVLLTEEEAK